MLHSLRTKVSLGTVRGSLGFKQGFDEFSDKLRPDWFRKADRVNAEVLPWLSQAAAEQRSTRSAAKPATRSARFFLWAHYSDPHEPYAPPGLDYPQLDIDEVRRRYLRDR